MLEFWYQALRSEKGIRLRTSDRDAVRQRLYKARRDATDQSLDNLSIVFPPEPDELWIIHKGPSHDAP